MQCVQTAEPDAVSGHPCSRNGGSASHCNNLRRSAGLADGSFHPAATAFTLLTTRRIEPCSLGLIHLGGTFGANIIFTDDVGEPLKRGCNRGGRYPQKPYEKLTVDANACRFHSGHVAVNVL